MITNTRKYKTIILAGLLGAYLAGSMHFVLLEGFHLMTHIAGELTTSIQHSYHNHVHEEGEAHTHRHIVLEKISDSVEDQGQDTLPSEDQRKTLDKKKPEQRSVNNPIAFLSSNKPINIYYKARPLLTAFRDIPTPPPRLVPSI